MEVLVIINKDEILAKSREENDVADERVRYIRLKGSDFSIGVLLFLWVVLSQIVPMDDIAKSGMGLLVMTTCFSNWLYQLIKSKTKTSILFTVSFFIAAIFFLVQFLKSGFALF